MRAEITLGKDWENLRNKTIAVVGVGGTGCTTAQLLAKLPLKKLILIDRDVVEESNLDRQVLFTKTDVGNPKVIVAAQKLGSHIEARFEDVNYKTISRLIPIDTDLIIDCTDNTETRLLINDYCKKHNIPWIYTAAVAQLGSAALITPNNSCFNCFNKTKYGQTCTQAGVLNSTVSFIGSFAVNLAINYLAKGIVDPNLHHFNLNTNEANKLKLPKDPSCKACNEEFDYLDGKAVKQITKLCGDQYAFNLFKTIDLLEIKNRIAPTESNDFILKTKDITVFSTGRIIIKADSEPEAKKKFDEILGI